MIIELDKINKDKRYKFLDNCFISYNGGLRCLVACIENNTRLLTEKQINTIYNYVRKNTKKIYAAWDKLNNTNLNNNFIQIDIYN